jgi:hypothetical protein
VQLDGEKPDKITRGACACNDDKVIFENRSGWAEQKTSRESCCEKIAIHHTCQPEFRRAKNCSFALRRLGQNAKQNESDDHFRLADHGSYRRLNLGARQ